MLRLGAPVEDAIVAALHRVGSCDPDDLVIQLPAFRWSQIFIAVGRMARDGRLVRRLLPRLGYQVSLPSGQPSRTEVSP